jgi:predicted nucleic acid-binding Zn ribbon protein
MKIIKDNVVKTVSDKAAKIAIQLMGWSEYTEAKRPSEIGTKTKPPKIPADQPIKLKDAKKVDDTFPGSNAGIDESKTIIVDADKIDTFPKEKKTRKSPVKSKSSK